MKIITPAFGFALLGTLCLAGAAHAADVPVFTAARSVHAWHPAPPAEWVYGEVSVEKSVPGSYFMAIGFSTGYCGIQELYDGSKIAIFSVWDPGNPMDLTAKADKVDEKIRTKVNFAGEGVNISRFGGEGTGGKSTLPLDWKIGETYRFALNVAKDGDHRTAYTGYIFRDGKWFKIATFSTLAAKGEASIRNIHSFVEDFRRNENSVKQVRRASFLNFFSKAVGGGEWKAIEGTRFSADNNPRVTIDMEAVENGFTLTTGGDTVNSHIKVYTEATTKVGPCPEQCLLLK